MAVGAMSKKVGEAMSLEEPRIEVEGVSATSAGAMNAAVMAHGLTTGGRIGAREALEEFWLGVARISAPFGALQLFEIVSRFLSPYQLNPFNYAIRGPELHPYPRPGRSVFAI